LGRPTGNWEHGNDSETGPRAPVVERDVTALPAVPTAGEHRKPVLGRPFPLGVSGNPAGRLLGSRNKLSEIPRRDLQAIPGKRPGILREMVRQGPLSGPPLGATIATSQRLSR
jgi:hypothetical protein